MPKAAQSKIGSVVAFFRTASLEVMEIGFDLVRDVVRERLGKSNAAKTRAKALPAASTSEAPATAAAPKRRGPGKKAKKAKGVRKAKKNSQAPAVTETALPLDMLSGPAEEEFDEADAGDLVAP